MFHMIFDMWEDGVAGKFMTFLFVGCIALVVFLAGWLILLFVDNSFLSYQEGKATVLSRKFEPAHSTTIMQTTVVGNITTLTPITTYYPDTYYVELTMNDMSGTTQVTKEMFDKLEKGIVVNVQYSKKRISNEWSFNSVNF